jgi:hypothetical protein
MDKQRDTFAELCCTSLGAFLAAYGYSYRATHKRPPGVAVEFDHKDGHLLFAACEGSVLYVDLIAFVTPGRACRISLDQALWFNNVRSVAEARSCEEQLGILVDELDGVCGRLLRGDFSDLDTRYCFAMSEGRDNYLRAQRGQ